MRSTVNSLLVISAIVGFLVGILKTVLALLGRSSDSWSSGLAFSVCWLAASIILYLSFNFVLDRFPSKR